MFADSLRLVSIHCIAQGLGASFLHHVVVPCDSTAFLLVLVTILSYFHF